MFLSGEELGNGLRDLCGFARERLLFVSPYVKRSSFEHFIFSSGDNSIVEKNLITTWDLSDIVGGASDLSVYPIARDHGWSVRLVEGLHAKVYVADHRALLGSANLTNSGFSLKSALGNIEAGTLLDVDQSMSVWLDSLLANSVLVDDDLYAQASKELAEVEPTVKYPIAFSSSLKKKLRPKLKVEIRQSDLFFCEEPMQLCSGKASNIPPHFVNHDRTVLGLRESATWGQICEGFPKSRAWFWLREAARESSSFGLLSSKLHREVGKNSYIRRKTVKKLLNNLLNWSMQILPGSVRIKRGRNQSMILRVESAGG